MLEVQNYMIAMEVVHKMGVQWLYPLLVGIFILSIWENLKK